ncbi:SURF1 family protein [Terrihabitans sp. B22-R8]|uniref:SURF1 family protein n=1 Tax=Terrihabitans sp. B22-R8 TaxID=3425128 RepID=UPI00403C3DD6
MSRRLLITLFVSATAFAILIGLGTWQLQRLSWKEALVTRISARVAEPVTNAPPPADWRSLDLDAWEYRPVEARGRFRNDLEVRVYTLLGEARGPLAGAGYWVLTPLERDEGGTIIVNRGFVPLDRAEPASRPGSQVDDEVQVKGLLRRPEDRNPFTPDDKPQDRLFYARDPAAIAAGLSLQEVAPFTIDARDSGPQGLPQGGETRLSFTNRHLEYALTWYGLAGALAAVLIAHLWRLRRTL